MSNVTELVSLCINVCLSIIRSFVLVDFKDINGKRESQYGRNN